MDNLTGIIQELDSKEISSETKEQIIEAILSKEEPQQTEKRERPKPHWKISFDYSKAKDIPIKRKYNKKITVAGKDVIISRLTGEDILRITAKLPYWLETIGYALEDIKKPEEKLNILVIINKIVEALFAGFNLDEGEPTEFAISLLEELSLLTNKSGKGITAEELYFSETFLDDVYNIINAILEVNKDSFFYRKVGNMIQPIVSALSEIIEPIKRIAVDLSKNLSGGQDNIG